MFKTNAGYQKGRKIYGTMKGTGLSFNNLIEKAKTLKLSLLAQYQKALNSYPMPRSVRHEINVIIAKRSMMIDIQ